MLVRLADADVPIIACIHMYVCALVLMLRRRHSPRNCDGNMITSDCSDIIVKDSGRCDAKVERARLSDEVVMQVV